MIEKSSTKRRGTYGCIEVWGGLRTKRARKRERRDNRVDEGHSSELLDRALGSEHVLTRVRDLLWIREKGSRSVKQDRTLSRRLQTHVKEPVLVLVLLVDGAHQRCSWRQDLCHPVREGAISCCASPDHDGGRAGTYLVDEDEDGLLGRQLDSLSDHIHKLTNSEVLQRLSGRMVSAGEPDPGPDDDRLRRGRGRTEGTRYFLLSESGDRWLVVRLEEVGRGSQ